MNKINNFFKNKVYVVGTAIIIILLAIIILPSPETGVKDEIIAKNTGPAETNVSITKDISEKSELFDVIKVVDGDTIDVSINGKTERLRLIGINTPETVDPRKPVECFGREASDKAKEILTGKKVYLEADPISGERDKYDRLLRFVFLEDGTNFNLLMIKEGFAYEYTYDVPYKYQAEFKTAQKEAETSKAGLWGDNICPNTISTDGVITTGSAIQTMELAPVQLREILVLQRKRFIIQ